MDRSKVNRDYDAFTELVATRSVALLRTAYLLTGGRYLAEDLLQAALIKAYPLVGGMREPASRRGHPCVRPRSKP
jgi:DNA-directed RNA polymerase specialized sigma24 family protein